MERLDCHIFSDKLCSSGPGYFSVGYWKIENDKIMIDESRCFTIRSSSLKAWYNVFSEFVFETTAQQCTNGFIDKFNSSNVQCKVESNVLLVENQSVKCIVSFTKAEACELLFGLSHLYVSTLGLPNSVAICLSEVVAYFASFPAKDFQQTKQAIKTMELDDLTQLLETIISKWNIKKNALEVQLALSRFTPLYSALTLMRIVKDVVCQ
jgi:hypothetical protein